MVGAIAFELARQSSLTLQKFGWQFWQTDIWDPVAAEFGARPLIWGTLYSSVLALLIKMAPLHTPEWDAWSTREATSLTGRWLITAHLPGRGNFYGQMEVQEAGTHGELSTRMKIQSVADGSTVMRSGRTWKRNAHHVTRPTHSSPQ